MYMCVHTRVDMFLYVPFRISIFQRHSYPPHTHTYYPHPKKNKKTKKYKNPHISKTYEANEC